MHRQSSAGSRAALRTRTLRFATLALLTLGAAAGCGGGGGDGTTNPNNGSLRLTLSPASLTVPRSASAALTVTVERRGGFAGVVNLSTVGLANGVAAAFTPAQLAAGETVSTLTISPAVAAATDTSSFSVKASGSGVADVTKDVRLIVMPVVQAGPFSMTLSVKSFLAVPPSTISAQPVLTITRDAGFTGPVALDVSGLPPGLVVGVTPTNVTGNTASLVIINGGAANGVYNVTIRGVAGAQGEQSIVLPITVAPATTGSIHWELCNGVRVPVWFFAVKDGNGPWTRIVPDANSHSFSLTQPTAQIAMVTSDSGGYRTSIYQNTAAEITAMAASECTLYPGASTRTANGVVTPLNPSEQALLGMGWWFASAASPFTTSASFSMLNLPAGPVDLLAVRGSSPGLPITFVPNKAILRRAVNPAAGATMDTLDFTSGEAFDLTSSTWNFGNTNGETFGIQERFLTASGTVGTVSALLGSDQPATARTVYAIPSAQTIDGDLQQLIATVQTVGPLTRATRQIVTYSRTLGARDVDFGPAMPAPIVTAVTTPSVLLRAQGTLPPAYSAGVAWDITQTHIARFATMQATSGFLGGSLTYDLQFPDLNDVLGWDTNFALQPGSDANYWVSGGGPVMDAFDYRYIFSSLQARWTGATTGAVLPAEGATYLMGRVAGSITP